MGLETSFIEEKGYIQVIHSGLFSELAEEDRITTHLHEIINRTYCRKILFDGRRMVLDSHISAIFFTGDHFDELGFDQSCQVSILYSQYEEKMKFLELVVQNRGYNVKVFKDEKEAVKWLTSDVKSENPYYMSTPVSRSLSLRPSSF
ncbi:MAG: hypothetical protein JXA25_19305 [Anaerolineales bacterium]|nr:hypothetical protein [Anaerolineales bacterium]